ncbi:hypothetical protein PHYSODRAFT_254988 [Phytophthora sojae]|uniref:Uncharacterized protein n=1 Tax=Phytophthora sojae (strain P6497) TaxID=1094619 RepID=G4YTE9_PHYSP|nr:hypothetical protein PHYSODRAFT_254988 [Phytophthora sojae]EGZ23548.1 hypothetical protein PHYSODRAFT_254988 [Phytophthora sojae]|eukprot:XP_009518836.1 hypothetical protein PHYSODRAFT_254988 [Phytophthora sojae]
MKLPTRQQWLPKYDKELCVRPFNYVEGDVAEAICKFCEVFGREDPPDEQADSAFDALVRSAKKKRKKMAKVMVFKTFRRDHIIRHMQRENSKQWSAFLAVTEDEECESFFLPTRIEDFLPRHPQISFVVPSGIASLIERLFCNRGDTPHGLVTVDDEIGEVEVSNDFMETETDGYVLVIRDRDQFETIVSCINAGTWGFSLMVDGATHNKEGYLDVRLSFGLVGKIHNIHLLAIPIGDSAHKGQNYAELVIDLLEDIGETNLLPQLIGISTDEAATMLGRHQGFSTRLRAAAEYFGNSAITINCALDELVNTFQLKYESNTEDDSVNVDKTKVANHLKWCSCNSLALFSSMDVGVQRDENATEDQTHSATDGTELDDASPDEQPDQNDVEYEIDPAPPQDPMTQTELVGAVAEAITVFIKTVSCIKLDINSDCREEPPTSPIEIIQCTDRAFCALLAAHSPKLKARFGATATTVTLEVVWEKAASFGNFELLAEFAVGLASIAPGTHAVEGDFSTLKRTMGPHRGRLSNYAMEGTKQFPSVRASPSHTLA